MVVVPTRLTLIGKPECHLCDDARAVIASVVAELGDAASISLDELSIHDDPELNARFWDEIPVLMIDGRVHAIWRLDAERLKTAILAATV
ncbi:MAG: glutaredoxin family protein [Salinibacterium sp.]|nr:glutaredoxin family protein [Salinibacterium sp.]